MLLANISVAEEIEKAFPSSAVLRHHPPPSKDAFVDLRKMLQRDRMDINISSPQQFQIS